MKVDHITNENIISPEEIQKASDTYFQLKRNVGDLYAQAFWNKWRESGNVNAALRMAQREYDRLMMKDSEEPKISSDAEVVAEAMSDAYGVVSMEPEVEGSVEFKQHKNTDKGSVSIEASGETLQDLADVLKLAGLTLPDAMKPSERPEEKPEEEPKADDHDHEDGEECDACAGEIDDPSYTTDKQAIIDRLRDTLKAKLIR